MLHQNLLHLHTPVQQLEREELQSSDPPHPTFLGGLVPVTGEKAMPRGVEMSAGVVQPGTEAGPSKEVIGKITRIAYAQVDSWAAAQPDSQQEAGQNSFTA